MGEAYPDLGRNRDFIEGVVTREEERFRQTLRTGLAILDDELDALAERRPRSPAATAFLLHDTYGFPLELTAEIAAERGVEVDEAGFEAEMAEQRRRAKDARKAGGAAGDRVEAYREIVEQFGPTEFTGSRRGRVRRPRCWPWWTRERRRGRVVRSTARRSTPSPAARSATPAPSPPTPGGPRCSTPPTRCPGLRRHLARVVEGEIAPGQEAPAAIDVERRDAIRRNHTGTHLLHWALREVLGEHVKQQGSLVAPDRLRFDFSHYEAVTPEQIARVEDLANHEMLADARPRTVETPKAEAAGAWGPSPSSATSTATSCGCSKPARSLELCGGTHVRGHRRHRARSRSCPRGRSARTCAASRPSPARARSP